MNNNYDSIDDALNIESDIVETKPVKKPEIVKISHMRKACVRGRLTF